MASFSKCTTTGIKRTASVQLIIITILLACGLSASAASWFDRIRDAVSSEDSAPAVLSTADIGNGLKEALLVGTENVVAHLGQTDGFNLDQQIRIPLPDQLATAQKLLAKVGMEGVLGDLEVRLNRAAEIATPKARRLFTETIRSMTLEDVQGIYRGSDDAATQFFRSRMSPQLAAEMTPVVDESLAEAGAVQAYDSIMQRYNAIPFAPKINANLSQYVVDQGMDGIFYYLAQEEAAIRQDPAKRTTELLQRVFTQGN